MVCYRNLKRTLSLLWAFTILVALVPLRSHAMSINRTSRDAEICDTEDCINIANRLKAMVDFSVDPCDDFYKFTCGKFMKMEMPGSINSLSTFTFLKNSVALAIKGILEQPIDESGDPPFIINAKNLYKGCLRLDHRGNNGLNYLKGLIGKLGGFPLLEGDKWNEDAFDLMNTLRIFFEEGLPMNLLFSMRIGYNLKNTSINMLEVGGADTVLDGRAMDEEIKKNMMVVLYHRLMTNIVSLMGADPSRIEDELWDVVIFEGALAKSKYIRRNRKEFVIYTLKELMEKYDGIPWRKFLDEMFNKTTVYIGEDEPISVLNEGFLEHASMLISSAPKRVLANYLIGRTIYQFITYLPEKYRLVYYEFLRSFTEVQVPPEPWVSCITSVTQLYTFALAYQYVKQYFDESDKHAALEIVNDIRSELNELLVWLDGPSKAEALKKLSVMKSYVGYPEELLDVEKLQCFYGNLAIDPKDSYLESYFAVKRHIRLQEKTIFRQHSGKKNWKRRAEVTDVNAFYNVVDNSIFLPAAVLQGAFFGKGRPNYLNFGGIGYIIGHEMTHAYDIQGSLFDFEGNMRDWWTEESKSRYLNKSACVSNQFGKFTVQQINRTLNGEKTASENLADSGGLTAAYSSYVKKPGKDPLLIGFEKYNPRQMFWISAGSIWCTIYRDQALRKLIRKGAHSPGEFRVNGAFANQVNFAKDFNCPEGSPMNPKAKCTFF